MVVSARLKSWRAGGFLLATCVVFAILNHGAYKGYFRDDDLDTLAWATRAPASVWLKGFLSPLFLANNFRPSGHIVYALLGRLVRLNFLPYIAALQALHLLNACLLWLLARRLGLDWRTSGMSAAFFALNVAAFQAYWEPMYGFDVLSATFCLVSVLLYLDRRWVLSFAAFWLAYKSKELAVMLPFIFLYIELAGSGWTGGARAWKRLLPFLVVALSFGIQGVLLNPNQSNTYAFHFTWAALGSTASYYGARVLLIPYGGLLLAAAAALTRDRRAWFGLLWCFLFFVPLLALPGRVSPAYVYVPEVGAALVVATAFSKLRAVWALVFFAAWLPWNIRELRIDRRATLASAEQVRPYVESMQRYASAHPNPPVIVFENAPPDFHGWGITGAARLAWNRPDLTPEWRNSPEGSQTIQDGGKYLYIKWNPPERRMDFLEHAGR